jgi:hypothetical protein
MKLLATYERNKYTAGQIGVTGCGQTAVYVYTSGAGWVANSANRESK